MGRVLPLGGALVGAVVLGASIAAAAIIEEGTKVDRGGGEIEIRDISGSRTHGTNQRLLLSQAGSELTIKDTGSTTLREGDAPGCDRKILDNEVVCPLAGISLIRVRTQFGTDQMTANAGISTPIDFSGGEDNDTAVGGSGNDTLNGGPDDDKLDGGDGDDEVDGGPGEGDDDLDGGKGADALEGDDDDDSLDGGDGPDQLDGGSGDDSLDGDPGDDVMNGRSGIDGLFGGDGDDQLDGGGGGDFIGGGDGFDTYIVPGFAGGQTGARTVTLGDAAIFDGDGDTVDGDVENVIGSNALDDIVGSPDDRSQVLDGRANNDELEGRGGPDSLIGDAGNDVIFSRDEVADTLISCGAGTDRVVADSLDVVDADCEDVDRGAANADGPGFDDPPGGADDQGEGNQPGGGGGGDAAGNPLPPELTFDPQKVKVSKKGVVGLLIRCVYLAAECQGSVELTAAKQLRVRIGRKRVTIKKGAAIGTAAVSIPWGRSERVDVKVTKRARQILERTGPKGISTNGKVSVRDSGAGATAPLAQATSKVTVVGRKKR